MCRLVAYSGKARALEEVIITPPHSLIEQSQAATEAKIAVNGDGFGFAWYSDGANPGLFREVLPAWSDGNLLSLCRMIKSHHFMAHVRASTVGETMRVNCHPFIHGRWSFMHNGIIAGFDHIKRQLESLLPDELYLKRRGTSDSELLFLLLLMNGVEESPLKAIQKTWDQITDLQSDIKEPNRITAVLANETAIYAFRKSSDHKSPSLYASTDIFDGAVTIASEPLDDVSRNWELVDEGSMITCLHGSSTLETLSL